MEPAAIGAERAIADDRLDDATRHVRQWVWGSMLILLLLAVASPAITVTP